jgi:ketosteroid isomerase-like protein
MGVAPHPYRTALEERDGDALREALHPEVIFFTPGFEEPIKGRDNVLMLFAVLADLFEQPVILDELEGKVSHAIAFRLVVQGHSIEGVDRLEFDDQGRVVRVIVTMRPLDAVQVLADRVHETVERLQTMRSST